MIDGIWWVVILLTVVGVLWLLAHLRGAKNGPETKISNKQTFANDSLQKTATLIKQKFSAYQVSRRANHLLITKQGKKIAMVTIDETMAVGERRLGELPIINYHRVPSRAQLDANLQDAE